MSNTTTIKLLEDSDAAIGVSSDGGAAALSFENLDSVRWLQVGPAKMRELASALVVAADQVEAAA